MKPPRSREERRARLLRWAEDCRTFLGKQKEIRLFVEHARGRGHEASGITLLRHLTRVVPLTEATRVTVVYKEEGALRKLEGFLDGLPLRFRSFQEIQREPWIDFGLTGASDFRRDLLSRVRCRSFLWMQPYRWYNPERICHRSEGVTTQDALVTHPWTADLGCPSMAYALPPPAEPDWAALKESRSIRLLRAVLAANQRPEVALFPVYGVGNESSMGESHLLLRNVLLGAHNALRRGLDAAVLVIDLSSDTQPEAAERLRRLLDGRADGPGPQVCTGVDEDPDRLRARIDGLRKGDLLLVHAGGYKPQSVFDYTLSRAKLPFVFEGAATASRAVTLGRPFLQASNRSFRARQLGRQPRSFEMAYPYLKGFGRSLPYFLQKAADSVLLLSPAPHLIGSVLLDCARGGTVPRYFTAMAERFGDPRSDRLLIALGLLELLRHRRDLRGLGPVRRQEWDDVRGILE